MVHRNSALKSGLRERMGMETDLENKDLRIDLARRRWVWDTGLVCQGQTELRGWAHRADEV